MNLQDTAGRRSFVDDPLTGQIIGAAIEVHRLLGPGLLESAYEECLCFELKIQGVPFDRQVPLPIKAGIRRLNRSVSSPVTPVSSPPLALQTRTNLKIHTYPRSIQTDQPNSAAGQHPLPRVPFLHQRSPERRADR